MKNLEKGLREGPKEIETSIKRADKNLKSLNPLIYADYRKFCKKRQRVFLYLKSSGAGGGDCGIA